MTTAPAIALAIAALAAGVSACGRTHDAPAPCATGPAPIVRVAAALPPGSERVGRSSLSSEPFADVSLLRFDRAGRPQPALARSWETRDRRTWTLTLREGLRAQNGEPLTAPRVRELLLAALASEPIYTPFTRDVEGIDAPTPATLVIRLARPNSMLPEALARVRLATQAGRPEWSAGPFRLVRDTPDEIVYEPFPGTWNGPPTVAGLHLRFFPSPRMAWAAFLRNEADVFYDIPPDTIPLLGQDQEVQIFDTGSRYTYVLGFQLRHPLLRDARVRQALNLAIDRAAVARRFFGTYAAPGPGPFSATYWAAEGAGETWPYDPVAARALLKAATGGRTRQIELVCLTADRNPFYADMIASLEAQLALVHVRLRIVTLPFQELLRRMKAGDFELVSLPALSGLGAIAPYYFWHSPQPLYRTHYTAADAALDALAAAGSDDEERAAVRAVLDVMRRDPPAVFVLPIPSLRAVRRKWRVPDGDHDIRRTLPYWTLAETPPCDPR
jgi:ABC-type transport system substrate-binding protein